MENILFWCGLAVLALVVIATINLLIALKKFNKIGGRYD